MSLIQLTVGFKLTASFECPVCEQEMFSEEANNRRVGAYFVGGVKYSICNNCSLPVEEITAEYKQRWDERAGKVKVYAHVG